MKKIISLVLCVAIIMSCTVISAFAGGGKNLIVFVAGIGQSDTYLFDEKYLDECSFENGTLHDYENYTSLIESNQYLAKWNMIYNINDAKKDVGFIVDVCILVVQIIMSCVLGKRLYSSGINEVASKWFEYNTIDENGKLPENVITPQYPCPLSEYPYHIDENGEKKSNARRRFDSSIPCDEIAKEKLGEDYEDYFYCFNYSSFSYTSDNVKALHEFIETILNNNKVGADRVVLVPMSMGASVVSAYLNEYPDVSENHVSKVVSIVGCWNGSDLVTDLLNCDYVDNSEEMFYKILLPGYLDKSLGKLPSTILQNFIRLFPRAELRAFIDEALDSIGNLILSTPSLLALVPSYDYESIRDRIPEGKVRDEADKYYECQITLKDRMEELEKQGVTFSFISAYGSTFGEISDDFNILKILASSATTNSDEIINISSTAPGTDYVAYDKTFEDETDRVLSPDKTIDISKTWYKDSSWFIYKEMHDLKDNKNALSLAVDLATGKIKTIYDCDSIEDGLYYPQFSSVAA